MRNLSRDLLPLGLAAGLIAIAAFAPVRAEDKAVAATAGLSAGTAHTIQIGYVSGVAYYTAERDGYHVVATLSVAGGAPVRIAATLQPEQAVSFSVPGAEGTSESAVRFARHGDDLMIGNPVRLVLN